MLTRCNVDNGAKQAGNTTIALGQHGLAINSVVALPIAPMNNRLVGLGTPARQQGGIFFGMQAGIFRREQVEYGQSDQGLPLDTKEALESTVDPQVTAGAIFQVNGKRNHIDQLLN